MTDNLDDLPSRRNVVLLVVSIVAFVFIVWLTNWIALIYVGGSAVERGQFGDMFGATNALFSGLALAGIIVAILLQKDELELQRKELRDTRKEMERSTIAQDASQKALNKQADLQILAAKISALGATLDTYNSLIEEHHRSKIEGFHPSPFEKNRQEALVELETLLKEIKKEKTV